MSAKHTTALCACLAMAACATQPAYQRPALPAPVAWANAAETPSGAETRAADETWWTRLHDPAIDALTAAALTDNPTLAQALARIDGARATLTVNKAQRLPQASASANATRAQSQSPVSSTGPYTLLADSAQAGPTFNWELDLWGRLRESANAARARLEERNADAQSTRLSLIAQVADGVLNVRACNYSLAVRDRDIASRETELDLMRKRLAVGNVAPVDEANASSNLATARTSRISQDEQCLRHIDALVALSGRDADTVRAMIAQPLTPDAGASSSAGSAGIATAAAATQDAIVMPAAPALQLQLPATVLLAHPSVMSAEREAAAAWAQIGVARANRLPKIDLAAAFTGQWLRAFGGHAHFNTWSIGPEASAPLFDGGSGAANVRGAEASYREALANLQATIRTTVQNIEDALAAQASAEQRVVTSQQAATAAAFALRANEARWHAGSISLFELEDARRQFNTAQETAIDAARDRAQAWVDLVRTSGNTATAAVADATPPREITLTSSLP